MNASAIAVGGSSGSIAYQPAGAGGDAEAHARAIGTREVFASAAAAAGAGAAGLSGNALARVEVTGRRGYAQATASSADAIAGFAEAAVKGHVDLAASVSSGAFTPVPDARGFVRSAHDLSDTALAQALAGNASVTAGVAGARTLALLEAGAKAGESSITFASELTMSASFLEASVGDELLIGFLDSELGGIRKLGVAVTLGNQLVFEGRVKPGKSLFEDQLLTVALDPNQDLHIAFGIKAGKSVDAGAIELLVARRGTPLAAFAQASAVPEPRVLALLAFAALASGGSHFAAARPRRERGGSPPDPSAHLR